jgi:hypothetical protein
VWWVLLALVLLGLALRLTFFNGVIGSDDINYFRYARDLFGGHHLVESNQQAARLILLTLVAMPGVLTDNIGVSELVNVALSTLLCAVVGVFCLRRIGPVAAITATAFLALDGVGIAYAGVLLPEPLLALLMFGSTVALYLATDPGNAGRQRWLIFVCGFMAGLAYSAKEPGILLLVPSAGVIMLSTAFDRNGRRLQLLVILMVGFAIPAGVEAGLLKLLTGDLFFKQHGLTHTHNATVGPVHSPISVLRDYWWKLRDMLGDPLVYVIPLGLSVLGWWEIIRRRSALLPFAAAGAFVLAYSVCGSTSLVRFIPIPLQERYLTPILVYGAVGIGAALQGWLAHRSRRSAVPVLACLVSLQFAFAVVLASQRSGTLYFTERYRNAQIALSALPDGDVPIYVDERVLPTLNEMLAGGLRTRLRSIDSVGPTQLGPGYYLVLGRGYQPTSPGDTAGLAQISRMPCATVVSTPQGWSLWRPKVASSGARDWAAVHWNEP